MSETSELRETRLAESARDRLALERTVLANERTLLAYVRTSLTLFVVGITLIHLPGFHPEPGVWSIAYHSGGWLFLVAAVVVTVISYRRYRHFQNRIDRSR